MSRITTKKPWLFNYYNSITYNNLTMPNLTARVALSQMTLLNESLYFTYTLDPSETRPDIIAAKYYDNSRLDWLVMITNLMINPKFDWPLSPSQLNEMIIAKYGSLEDANTVSYYKLASPTPITSAQYDALTNTLKTYWQPSYDSRGNIIQYTFKKDDMKLSTGGYNLLSLAEQAYWSSVSYYDDEVSENDAKRTIKLLNKAYVNDVVEQLREAFA